ncbi:MAG: universal stress protein [Rhodoferax sp.]|nr:universal stress protein [Actinomycetota bacterium]
MDRIVVGVDAGAAGVAAMQWALTEAVRWGVPLSAVRAWSPSVYGNDYSGVLTSRDGQPAERTDAQQLADEQLTMACARVPGSDTVVCSGTATGGGPAQVLLDASGPGVLLVVGTRGHGVLSRAVMGSVSSSVLHHVHGPVVAVPEPAPRDNRPGRVVVGVDHSPASLAALAVGAEHARRRNAVLVPVYVQQPILGDMPGLGAGFQDLAALEAVERRSLELTCQEIGSQGAAPVEAEVIVGHAGSTLTALTRPQDLLVVGSRGRGGFAALLLGSTSTQCVQHATCPVLVVR